jgi:hypothetical protein
MLCDKVNACQGSVRTLCLYLHPKTEAENSSETLITTMVHGVIYHTMKLLPLTTVSTDACCVKHSNVTINFTCSDVEDARFISN